MTFSQFERIDEAYAAFRLAWAESLTAAEAGAGTTDGSVPADVASVLDGMNGSSLAELVSCGGALGRAVGFFNAACAAAVARRSRKEDGPAGLAAQRGFTSPAAMIAAATGTSTGNAKRLVEVGEATTGPVRFDGGRGPAKYPHVTAALTGNLISVDAAALITGMLDRVAGHASVTDLDTAEATLVGHAGTDSFELLAAAVKTREAELDAAGLEPTQERLHAERTLKIWEERSGAIGLRGRFDPETGAPIKAAIDALVAAELRRAQDAFGSRNACTCGDDCGGICADPALIEDRTVTQINADALADLARHALGCTHLPGTSTTVVVRTTLDTLREGLGYAEVDGIDQPLSASAARRLAANADIIPVVLGTNSEVLDLGRKKRLFTPAQKIAIGERDGGCAFPGCARPQQFTHVHHRDWWKRDDGPTNLTNGVLLCGNHHHITHHGNWTIALDHNGHTWFTPPATLDPAQRPRPGNHTRRTLTTPATPPPTSAPASPPGITPLRRTG